MTTLTLCSPALPSARRQTRRLATSPQRLLPFPAHAIETSRNPAPKPGVVRLSTEPKLVAPTAVAGERAGAKFARQRVAYAVETVGSGIMLVGFLVLALFG